MHYLITAGAMHRCRSPAAAAWWSTAKHGEGRGTARGDCCVPPTQTVCHGGPALDRVCALLPARAALRALALRGHPVLPSHTHTNTPLPGPVLCGLLLPSPPAPLALRARHASPSPIYCAPPPTGSPPAPHPLPTAPRTCMRRSGPLVRGRRTPPAPRHCPQRDEQRQPEEQGQRRRRRQFQVQCRRRKRSPATWRVASIRKCEWHM